MSRTRMELPTPKRKVERTSKFESEVSELEQLPVAGTWLKQLREIFSQEVMTRGLEAAQAGKVRRVDFKAGSISAQVRAEVGDTRRMTIHAELIPDRSWDRVVEAMSGEAIYAACLLERELPPDLEQLFVSQGVPLVPTEADSLDIQWDGDGHPELWRAAALGWLVAQKLAADPLMILEFRGQLVPALSDRLRQQRTLMTRGGAAAHPDPPLAADILTGAALNECADRFWRLGTDFDEARRPAVLEHIPHALLRRLGPSTMESGKFPLSGLLATIYDTVADHARSLQEGPSEDPPSES